MASISKTVRPKRSSNRTVTPSGFGLAISRGTPAAAAGSTATQIVVTTQPAGAATGVAFTTQPIVQLRDGGGGNVSEAGVTITAYLISGSGTLGGARTAVTNSSGTATFANLQITGTGAHVLGFHALMSNVQTIWSDDVETDRSASYFEVQTEGGVFGRASVDGSMRWRSVQSGAGPAFGDLKLGIGRTPSGVTSVGPTGVDFGKVTMECDIYHSANNLTNAQDKCLRMSIFADSSWSQAGVVHIWSDGGTVLKIDPVTSVVNGAVTAVGWNDFAHFTWTGATSGTTALFGATATTLRRLKVVWTLNAPGQSNGTVQLYLDGVLDAQQTGLDLRGTYTSYGINALHWENYRTGGVVTANNRMYDNLAVSGQAQAVVAASSLTVSESGGSNPHEPAGMTVGFNEAWLTVPPSASSGSGWYVQQNASRVSVVTDPTSPMSDHSCLQLYFPAGAPGGVESMWLTYNESPGWPTTNNTGTLYLRMRVKMSSNWSDGGNNGTKFIWPRPRVENTAHFSPISRALGGMTVGFNFQGSYLGGADDDNEDPTPRSLGDWHDVEWLLYQGTTAAANNGTIQIWVDGVLVVNEINKKYANDGNALGWKYMDIAPTFGFGTNAVPHDQYIWIDHFYASYK